MFVIGGENLIDFIQEPDTDGPPYYRAVAGGSPYNVAKALALQQVDTGYLTPVSRDTLGDLLVEGLPDKYLTLLATRSELPSSLAVVSLKAGQPEYRFYRENTAERDVTLETLNAALQKKPTGFYIGSLAITDGADADAWETAWITAYKRGVFTVIDPNIRPAFIHDRKGYLARLDRMLEKADLIKLSDEDLAWITPEIPLLEAARQMFDNSNAALLVLTLGSKGAVAFTDTAEIHVNPAPVPDLKDTVGAGDTFMATLIARIMARDLMDNAALRAAKTETIRDILEIAAKAAAINCGRVGCNPPVLSEL